MGLLDSIGATARKAQLAAEIKLVERERTQRLQTMGVELYDLIDAQRKSQDSPSEGKIRNVEKVLQVPLEKCSTDVRKWDLEVAEQQNTRELILVRPDKDKESLSRRVGDQASMTKIATRIVFLQREMRLRKQEFGIQVWDVVSQPQWLHGDSCGLSKEELAVQACVNKAKDDIRLIEEKKNGKLEQIQSFQKTSTTTAH
ncbi:MAG: hypothetical protein SGILL_003665 [Bacillariaceae sp.]